MSIILGPMRHQGNRQRTIRECPERENPYQTHTSEARCR
jgi:hypothetical protein